MSRWMHRFGSTLALAGYLLATAAASLHQHDHHHVHFDIASAVDSGNAHSHCSHAHSHCSHSHGHSHSHGTGSEQHHHHGIPLHDDDCAVCQFHAMKVVSAPTVVVVGHVEIVIPAEPLSVLAPEVPVLSRPLSRGPPAEVIA
jgi:hypothetical protein